MTQRIRISRMVMAAGVLMAAMVLLISSTSAQPIAWNPPCGGITIRNTSAVCDVTFTLVTTPGFLPIPINIPAGGTAFFTPVPNPLMVDALISFNGNFYPMVSPGPVMPFPAPPVASCGWIPNVALGPPPGCCFDVFFDCRPGQCNVWLIPKPPFCRP